MNAGIRRQRILLCGLFLLAACPTVKASLIDFPLTGGDFTMIQTASETHWVFLVLAGAALLGILAQGKPGVRR